ncbi:hypothetical protein HOD08_02030 [bacterium]|jgi:hypothetical protein|nr:hypothetical protein [bacterium]
MRLIKLLAILIFVLAPASSEGVVILVHGTWSRALPWYKQGGGFFSEVTTEAAKTGQHVASFEWSGLNNHIARVRGARDLACKILEYPFNEEVTLIGHSHGGNLINLTTIFLYNPLAHMKSEEEQKEFFHGLAKKLLNISSPILQKAATPVEQLIVDEMREACETVHEAYAKLTGEKIQPKTKRNKTIKAITDVAIEKIGSAADSFVQTITMLFPLSNLVIEHELMDAVERENAQSSQSAENLPAPIPTEEKENPNSNQTQKKIKSVFLLGTPVDSRDYHPDMNVAQHVFALYSKHDIIQPVIGLYDRVYPEHERITNMQVFVEQKNGKQQQPGHLGLHRSFIGTHILSIPKIITGKFGSLENNHNLQIKFFEGTDKAPEITNPN